MILEISGATTLGICGSSVAWCSGTSTTHLLLPEFGPLSSFSMTPLRWPQDTVLAGSVDEMIMSHIA